MRWKKVESAKNFLIREARLLRDRRGRSGRGAFLAEGPNLVASALDAGGFCRIERVFATERFMARSHGLIKRLSEGGADIVEVSDNAFKKLSSTETPQGIAAAISCTPPALDELEFKGVTVVLDGIQDPGNLGTIVRTADAFGCEAVVIVPGTCDAFSPKALRATAGSVFHLPLVYSTRETLPGVLKSKGVKLVLTEPRAKKSLSAAGLAPPLALVFGNEARGVSLELKAAADLSVKIPIRGGAESLNVAVTAAVCLWEATRARE